MTCDKIHTQIFINGEKTIKQTHLSHISLQIGQVHLAFKGYLVYCAWYIFWQIFP